MYCLVGLGNPGSRYHWNHHNIGYLFLDYLNCEGSFTKGMGDYLEGKTSAPADTSISDALRNFDEDRVHSVWSRALERDILQ